MSKKIICLDPGHGGKDSGAVGYGRQEKNDVLTLAKMVGKNLKPYATVKYTRTTDRYDSPSEKAAIANKYDADFLMSIHRNSAGKTANGYETLVYSNNGKKEKCASLLNSEMEKIGFTNRGTKIGTDLSVLKRSDMPAVLTENGFISNAKDNAIFVSKMGLIADILALGCLTALGTTIASGSITKTGIYHKKVEAIKDCPIRTGRGKTNKKIGTLKIGDRIKVWYVLENTSGNLWGSVDYNNQTGYIYMGKVREV
ncbi:MAG: N-acetylmuramoyl-L-alanine amidase [Lachnospiraceae bacterium]|nr:N-acetylmuramoyl-L-alanine amidase [Lachnospiraceae bacterium]